MRHGETPSNLNGLFSGRTDVPLTERGIQQARNAGGWLLRQGISVDLITASTLRRAQHTAEIVGEIIDVREVIFDERLLEFDLGDLEGKPAKGVPASQRIAMAAEDPGDFHSRVTKAVGEYQQLPGSTLLVAHDAVGRAIRATGPEYSDAPYDPSQLYEVEKYPNAWVVPLDWLSGTTPTA